jgi:hypothetical protein
MTTNFTTFQSQIYNAVAASSLAVDWGIEFPLVIDRAEQRCYRDLDMLNVRADVLFLGGTFGNGLAVGKFQSVPSSTTALASFTTQTFNPPFIAIEEISVVTPIAAPSSGSVTPLVRSSPQFIDLCWPNDATEPGPPQYYAMVSDNTFLVGPPADQRYSFRMRGPVRPTPLSASNSSTPLTILYGDLFFAAAMIEVGMYMRFVEPQMATNWTQEYGALKTSALVEEMRKRNMAEGWVDKQPSPIATPPRT